MANFDWDALAEIIPDRHLPPPDGSFTSYDFADKRGISRSSADQSLRNAVRAGKLNSDTFWCAEKRRLLTYYWIPE